MSDKLKTILMFAGLIVAVECIIGAGTLSMIAFMWSRNDHDMKLIALTGVISIASQMMATASTLLVGRAFGGNEGSSTGVPSPLPDNSTLTQSTTLKTTTGAPA